MPTSTISKMAKAQSGGADFDTLSTSTLRPTSTMPTPVLVLDNGAYTIKAGVVGQDGDPR